MTALQEGGVGSAAEMAASLAAGEVTSVRLVEGALAHAAAWQPITNACSQLWPDTALVEAAEWDDARAAGGEAPRFAGVPLLVKDLYDVAGRETTGCCRAYAGRIAEVDAPTIAAVRRAGLVMIGKTNQHELAYGGTNRYSSIGPTANPWDPSRMTGGSSGGSAAAVAAGVVPWALGSDTGGSIRIPSSFCGTVGLKPTTGRIAIDGMLPLAPSMDTPGPIAGNVEDAAALWRILAGRDDREAPVPAEEVAGTRLGVVEGYYAREVHPEVLGEVERVARRFESAGAHVERVDGEGIDDARMVWRRVTNHELVAAHPALRGRWGEILDPFIPRAAEDGERQTTDERAALAARRAEIAAWFRERLRGRDALIVPTTGYPAQPFEAAELVAGDAGRIDLTRVQPGWFTCPANLSGLPAISLPAGWSTEGLPFGVTLIGSEDAEPALLSLAAWWEGAVGLRRRPELPSGDATGRGA